MKRVIFSYSKQTCSSKYLIDHVPIESVEHILSMCMLVAKGWPQLRSDPVVQWPRVFPYDHLSLPLSAGLEKRIDLIEGLQRLLLAGGRLWLYDDVRRVDVRRECVVDIDIRLLLEYRQHIRQIVRRGGCLCH